MSCRAQPHRAHGQQAVACRPLCSPVSICMLPCEDLGFCSHQRGQRLPCRAHPHRAHGQQAVACGPLCSSVSQRASLCWGGEPVVCKTVTACHHLFLIVTRGVLLRTNAPPSWCQLHARTLYHLCNSPARVAACTPCALSGGVSGCDLTACKGLMPQRAWAHRRRGRC